MSMIRCSRCDCAKNSDIFDFEFINGKDVCCDCLALESAFVEFETIGVNSPFQLGLI